MASGIPIASGFLLGSQQPVDLRTVVDTYADLQAMPIIQRHLGLLVYVTNDKQYYYIKDDLNIWEIFNGGSGGSGGSILYTNQEPSTIAVGGVNIGFKPKPTGIPLEKLAYLMLHAGSTDIVKSPVLVQSTYDGQSNIPVDLEYIAFDITNDINTVLKDITKVTSNPSGAIKDVTLVGTKLYVYLNPLNTGTIYDVKLDLGVILNEGDDETSFGEAQNDLALICSFETAWLSYPISPTVLPSSMDGVIDQPLSLSEITFDVNDTFNLTLDSVSSVISSPTNIINTVTLVGNTIHVGLHNLANLTNYTVTVNPNTVENNGDNIITARTSPNTNTVSCTFKTIAPDISKPVILQSSMNGLTEQNIYTTEITFPVSNAIAMTLKDGTQATISSSGVSATIGTATLDGLNVLHIPILTSKLEYSTTYTISILANIVENHGDGINNLNSATNTNSVTTSFSTTTKPKPQNPIINQSAINNTNVVSVNLSEITFQISNDFNLSLADATKITCNKTGVIGTPTLNLATKTIHIPIISTLAYYTSYTITLQSGLIVNNGDNVDTFGTSPNASISASFITEPTLVTPPIVQNSSINGLSNQSRTLTEVVFPISNFIGTTIKDSTKITCDHAVIGTPTISGSAIHIPIVTTLDFLTTYSISINASAIQNNGDGISALSNNPNTNSVTCTFTTIDRPVVSAPTILQSNLNNATNQLTTLSEITFDVSNAIGLTLVNGLKVTSNPSGIIGTATLIGNAIHVPLSGLNTGTTYTVSILAGIVQNNGDNITTSGSTLNSNTITATFKTKAGNVSQPIVQQSSSNGLTNQQITLSEITFGVSNAIGTTLKDGSRVSISPSGTVGIATLSSNTLHIPLSNITYSTTYSVSVLDGIVTNNGDGINSSGTADNTNTVTASFTTRAILSAPSLTASTSTSYPENTTQIIYTINQSSCTLLDTSKIVVTGANKGTVSISGNQLIIPIGGMVSGNTVTVNISSGAIANSDGVSNGALSDYTFSITDASIALPAHDFELTIPWSVGIMSLNLISVTGYSPSNVLNATNYTTQKIQVYFVGVKADLDSGIPEKNERIPMRDYESSATNNTYVGKWYMSSLNVIKFLSAPLTDIKIKIIKLI